MSENKWETWEMAAVNSKYILYMTQLLVAKGIVSKAELQNLCEQLVANVEQTSSEGATEYAKIVSKSIIDGSEVQ